MSGWMLFTEQERRALIAALRTANNAGPYTGINWISLPDGDHSTLNDLWQDLIERLERIG